MAALLCLSALTAVLSMAAASSDRLLLKELSVLTLYHGRMTTARRSSPIPQVKCMGGSAGCSSYVPQVIQCYNRGYDGYDVQWECKTDMDNEFRFGQVEVSCEGFEYPDDPYILRGSCGLEYTIDYTKEGHQHQQAKQHSYYADSGDHSHSYSGHKKYSKGKSWLGDVVTLCIIAVVIYAIYKSCISSDRHDTGSQHRTPNMAGAQPPPPGFRPDYMPDDCSSSGTNYNTGYSQGYARPRQTGFGNFWGGAATGGLLGYMLGSRTNTGYQRPHYGGGSSWGTGTGWGSGSGWGGSGSSWGGGASSGGSSGTRTASGFGGTKRR